MNLFFNISCLCCITLLIPASYAKRNSPCKKSHWQLLTPNRKTINIEGPVNSHDFDQIFVGFKNSIIFSTAIFWSVELNPLRAGGRLLPHARLFSTSLSCPIAFTPCSFHGCLQGKKFKQWFLQSLTR